jgi:hypothetical protein
VVPIDAACDGGHFESGLVVIGWVLADICKFCCDVAVAGWQWLFGVTVGKRVAVAGWKWYRWIGEVLAVILSVVWLTLVNY